MPAPRPSVRCGAWSGCGEPWSPRADDPSRGARECAPPFSGGGTFAECPAEK